MAQDLLGSGTVDGQGHAGLSSVDLYAGRTSSPGSACSLKLNHSSGYLACLSVPGTCLFHRTFHKIISFFRQIYELRKVAAGNNMRGQGEPWGPERTGQAPEKQYSEFRAAQNTQLRSETFKSVALVVCLCEQVWGSIKADWKTEE